MKPGDKFKAAGSNPPSGGSFRYNPKKDEFECLEAPAEAAVVAETVTEEIENVDA